MNPAVQAPVAVAAHEQELAVVPSTEYDLREDSYYVHQDTSNSETDSTSSGGLDIELDDGASDDSLYQHVHLERSHLSIVSADVQDILWPLSQLLRRPVDPGRTAKCDIALKYRLDVGDNVEEHAGPSSKLAPDMEPTKALIIEQPPLVVHQSLLIDAPSRAIPALLHNLTFRYSSKLQLFVNLDDECSANTPVLASLEAQLDEWVAMLRRIVNVSQLATTRHGRKLQHDCALFLGFDLRKSGDGFSLYLHFDGASNDAAPVPQTISIRFQWSLRSQNRPANELPTVRDVTRIALALLSSLPHQIFDESQFRIDLFFKFSSFRGRRDEGWLDQLGTAWEGLASLFPNIKWIDTHYEIARAFLHGICRSYPWRFFPLVQTARLERLEVGDLDLLEHSQAQRRSLYIEATVINGKIESRVCIYASSDSSVTRVGARDATQHVDPDAMYCQ